MEEPGPVPVSSAAVPLDAEVERSIMVVRGRKVMLDMDLARLYGVPTRRLNEQVRRNLARFPDDFLFRLTAPEVAAMRSQFATASVQLRNLRFPPYAFTEHGATMLSAVLKSRQAVAVSVAVVRAFIRMRQLLDEQARLVARLDDLERRYDGQFQSVFVALRDALSSPVPRRARVGFVQDSTR